MRNSSKRRHSHERVNGRRNTKFFRRAMIFTWKGSFVRARLCVRGFNQVVRDLDDIYASTPAFSILKLLLLIALSFGLSMVLYDISTAFLHAATTERILVRPPREFYPDGNVMWLLKRAMYGLRSAPADWQRHFAEVMSAMGFRRLQTEPNVYISITILTIIFVHVDDLILFCRPDRRDDIEQQLKSHFLIKYLANLNDDGNEAMFLGRLLRRTGDKIAILMKSDYFD